jgi:hypothetical protein
LIEPKGFAAPPNACTVSRSIHTAAFQSDCLAKVNFICTTQKGISMIDAAVGKFHHIGGISSLIAAKNVTPNPTGATLSCQINIAAAILGDSLASIISTFAVKALKIFFSEAKDVRHD